MDRVIGEIEGQNNGPLIILIGSIHGNETAGIKAIESVFKRIREDHIELSGKTIGLVGNMRAHRERKRYIDYDLNRAWREEHISRLRMNGRSVHFHEDFEMLDLLDFFDSLSPDEYTTKICADLHTTSSDNGNFIVVPELSSSHPVIQSLKLPLIMDLEKHIKGTLLHYLGQRNIMGFAFEGGLIGSEISVKLHIAGIWETLISSGAVKKEELPEEIQMNTLLQTFATELPHKLKVRHHYWITEGDDFRMKPGYVNFQKVKKGEEIAEDRNGIIKVPMDGLIFMPLYQRSGNDGFFIVQEIDPLN